MASLDYYEILEIERTADDSEIKKAYRKMALRWHPDKNPEKKEEAEAKFKEISEAYEVLSDKDKRHIYNVHGKEGLADAANGSQTDCDDDDIIFVSNGRRHRHRGNAGHFFRFAFRDPMDIFREVFGGNDPFADLFPAPGFSIFGNDIFGGMDPFLGMPSIFSSFQQLEAPGCSRRNRVGNTNSSRSNRLQPYNNHNHSNHRSNHAMDIRNGGLDSIFNSGMSLFGGFPGMSMNVFNAGGGGATGGGSFRSSSTSTKVVNGRTVVTKKVVENGIETITVESNGQVESKTVNGRRVI